MSLPATAHAQADEALKQAVTALDDAAVALKRQHGASRKALQSVSATRDAVRQVQLNLLGISVETAQPLTAGGTADDNPQDALEG